jgi:hypothetical protein
MHLYQIIPIGPLGFAAIRPDPLFMRHEPVLDPKRSHAPSGRAVSRNNCASSEQPQNKQASFQREFPGLNRPKQTSRFSIQSASLKSALNKQADFQFNRQVLNRL